jgi:hypothetical protein
VDGTVLSRIIPLVPPAAKAFEIAGAPTLVQCGPLPVSAVLPPRPTVHDGAVPLDVPAFVHCSTWPLLSTTSSSTAYGVFATQGATEAL